MRFVVDPPLIEFGALSWFFLIAVGVVLPGVVLLQHRQDRGVVQAPRAQLYTTAFATHAALVLIVWGVARAEKLDFFPSYRLTPLHVTIGLLALAIGLLPALERFQVKDPVVRERTRLIAPRTPREFCAFYALSITAGIAEEVAIRGLLFTLIAALLWSFLSPGAAWVVAAVVAAGIFGIIHLFQGWKGAGIAALMGLREQIVVGLTGTLYVAIAVHMVHDIIAGTVIGIKARAEDSASRGERGAQDIVRAASAENS
jgi:membrane protease YdiL (CAAX protease family)